MFIFYNPNGSRKLVGDCVVRAITKLENISWDEAYWGIVIQGFVLDDMPSSNAVWSAYLRLMGFIRTALPNYCPDCYTVKDFCEDNPKGKYILAIGTHVVAVEDGDYYDTWDSGDEVPIFYWRKEQ